MERITIENHSIILHYDGFYFSPGGNPDCIEIPESDYDVEIWQSSYW